MKHVTEESYPAIMSKKPDPRNQSSYVRLQTALQKESTKKKMDRNYRDHGQSGLASSDDDVIVLPPAVEKTPAFDPDIPDTSKGDFYCRICDAHNTTEIIWANHITGKRHLKNRAKKPNEPPSKVKTIKLDTEAKLYQHLSNVTEPIIGLDCVSELQRPNFAEQYTCFSCGATQTTQPFIEHICSTKHRLTYIKKVDEDGFKLINGMRMKGEALDSIVEEHSRMLEAKEGRGKIEVKMEKPKGLMSTLQTWKRKAEQPSRSPSPLTPIRNSRRSPLSSRRSPLPSRRSPLSSRRSPLSSRKSPLSSRRSPLSSRRSPFSSRRSPVPPRRSPFSSRRSSPKRSFSPRRSSSQKRSFSPRRSPPKKRSRRTPSPSKFHRNSSPLADKKSWHESYNQTNVPEPNSSPAQLQLKQHPPQLQLHPPQLQLKQHPPQLKQHPPQLQQHPPQLQQHPQQLQQHPQQLQQHPPQLQQHPPQLQQHPQQLQQHPQQLQQHSPQLQQHPPLLEANRRSEVLDKEVQNVRGLVENFFSENGLVGLPTSTSTSQLADPNCKGSFIPIPDVLKQIPIWSQNERFVIMQALIKAFVSSGNDVNDIIKNTKILCELLMMFKLNCSHNELKSAARKYLSEGDETLPSTSLNIDQSNQRLNVYKQLLPENTASASELGERYCSGQYTSESSFALRPQNVMSSYASTSTSLLEVRGLSQNNEHTQINSGDNFRVLGELMSSYGINTTVADTMPTSRDHNRTVILNGFPSCIPPTVNNNSSVRPNTSVWDRIGSNIPMTRSNYSVPESNTVSIPGIMDDPNDMENRQIYREHSMRESLLNSNEYQNTNHSPPQTGEWRRVSHNNDYSSFGY